MWSLLLHVLRVCKSQGLYEINEPCVVVHIYLCTHQNLTILLLIYYLVVFLNIYEPLRFFSLCNSYFFSCSFFSFGLFCSPPTPFFLFKGIRYNLDTFFSPHLHILHIFFPIFRMSFYSLYSILL